MRQAARYTIDGATLWLSEWIIRFYLRYILIRCAKFTGNRDLAREIASYALVTTCLLAGELEHLGQFGFLVDTMVDVIGRDVIRQGRESPDVADAPGARLFADGRLLAVAEVLNRLDRFTRQVLVFHFVDSRDADAIAELLHRPATEVMAAIIKGQRILAKRLGGGHSHTRTDAGGYVRPLLAAFAAALDANLAQQVGNCARGYLAQHATGTKPLWTNRWTMN
jgi:hypothetical protein